MTLRFMIILISLSACASTAWKNDPEKPLVKYADQLVSYEALSDEAIFTLKRYITEKLIDLIDHANNASNEAYTEILRSYSKAQVIAIMNIPDNEQHDEQVVKVIDRVRKTSLEKFQIHDPEIDNDSTLYSEISIDGEAFIKAIIQQKNKLFVPDTLKVWEVDFMYLEKAYLEN